MGEGEEKGLGPPSEKMEQFLRERERLDRVLQEKFRRKRAILFSDVSGYTRYMETFGDIAGRTWIQKHHDVVLPIIRNHEGEILDVMGDGVMASFLTTLSAVKASIAMQRALNEINAGADKPHHLHVKVGINAGDVLVQKGHVAGDVVNTAARIQAQAAPDQILVDKSVYSEVCGTEDILCRYHGTVQVPGKNLPVELYKVMWQDEDTVSSTEEPKKRAPGLGTERVPRPPLKVLHLEFSQEEDHLKLSASETNGREVSTIKGYEEIPFSKQRIDRLCGEIVENLNSVNRKSRLTRDGLSKLRDVGQMFRDELFTPDVKEKIGATKADHLILSMDDRLVHIPWELIHDGREFLCQRFSMGRLVRTRQTVPGRKVRSLGRPFKMLILVDPRGDLEGAHREGTQIRDFMDKQREFVNVSFRAADITKDFIRQKVRNFDLVHFAGHAEYHPEDPGNSGWQLTDGVLTARDIMTMAGTAAMPALVFSNACHSARTTEWRIKEHFQDEIFGLANAFVLSGVKHYVGSFWEILDEPGRRFALECYEQALSGKTVGEAVRQARLSLIKEYGEETIVWASYLLYGDPTFNYVEEVMAGEVEEPSPPHKTPPLEGAVRTAEQVIDVGKRKAVTGMRLWAGLASAVLVILIIVLFGYPGFLRTGTEKLEKEALSYYQTGQFNQALMASKTLMQKNPSLCMPYLIQGNILLRRGKLDEAEASFQKAWQADRGTVLQKAEAMTGLGRVASLRKDRDKALDYYRKATQMAPGSKLGYLSQALLLEDKGDYGAALSLFEKAYAMEPQDTAVAGMANETRKRVGFAEDQGKQEHINTLVKELLESMKSPPRALPWDGWTSLPLTLWILDFETQGYSSQEGEERLLVAGISEQLLQKSRVQLVERQLLERLLDELKLGTSNLADRTTALAVGKLLAARLILSGRIAYSDPQTQISLRLIETETGQIRAAMNEAFGSLVPVFALSEMLSNSLMEKLSTLYPLRGKVSEIKEGSVMLNIGQNAGVVLGQKFKAVDEKVSFEVTSVQSESCLARIMEGEQVPQKEMRVEALAKTP